MHKGDALSLFAGLSGGLSSGNIARLTDAEWWTLAALISQWIDLNEESDIFATSHLLARLSRAEAIGAIIALLATGQLEVELSIPESAPTAGVVRPGVGFRLDIAASGPEAFCPVEEVAAIHTLVANKLGVIRSAAERVAGGAELH